MSNPSIRFESYSDSWQTPTINDTFELRNGYTPSKSVSSFWTNGTIPWFRMEDIRTNGGILSDSIQHITPSAVKGAGLFTANSIIFSTTATIGEHALIIADSLANQQFTNLKIRKSLVGRYNPYFVYYAFFKIDQWALKNTNAGGLLSVDMKSLVKQPFPTPSIDEQNCLASYFKALDSKIQSSAKKIESLKQLKAASLISMFPQHGETKPRLRFKGFEGEWEIKKVGDISTSFSGGTPSAGVAQYYGGPIPFIRSGEINKSHTQLFITEKGLKASSAKIVEKGTLLYALYGATSGEVGFSQIQGAINQAILAIITTKGYDSRFLGYFLRANKKHIIGTLLQGGQGNLSGALVKDISVNVPSEAEQRQIADFFTALDRRITLETQRLEKLKQIKSACLDKMFV